jgi:hypothetical protein
MTQQELADAAHVDLKTIYNLESGTRWPIAKNRVAVSAALRWEADALAVIAAGAEPGDAAAVAHADPGPPRLPDPPEGEVFGKYSAAAAPLATRILSRLEELRQQGIQDPDGPTMFPHDEALATGWETGRGAGLVPEQNLWVLAIARTGIEHWRREQEHSRAGRGSA